MDISIIGTIFTNVRSYGDYYHMIASGKYNDSLFIYNDNEESYYNESYQKGAGNACIRVFNKYNPLFIENPMSVGIPTGTLKNGGYDDLNENNAKIINNCFDQIINLIKSHNKKRLFYSAKNMTGILGSGIFEIDDDVLKYITHRIYTLTKSNIFITASLPNSSFEPDDDESDDSSNNNKNINT